MNQTFSSPPLIEPDKVVREAYSKIVPDPHKYRPQPELKASPPLPPPGGMVMHKGGGPTLSESPELCSVRSGGMVNCEYVRRLSPSHNFDDPDFLAPNELNPELWKDHLAKLPEDPSLVVSTGTFRSFQLAALMGRMCHALINYDVNPNVKLWFDFIKTCIRVCDSFDEFRELLPDMSEDLIVTHKSKI